MLREVDKNYGADYDGNRGITVISYEIDDDDYDEIKDYISENWCGECYEDTMCIHLNTVDDTVFEDYVEISNYFTLGEFEQLTKGK